MYNEVENDGNRGGVMIKVLILYYLSIKSTHGYEIQKFIQVNHLDRWTKIQSGSIYYALARLSEQGLIELTSKSGASSKARKTYKITVEGRVKLKKLVEKELESHISSIGSDKFIVYPILDGLDKEIIIKKLNEHVNKLLEKKKYLETWQKAKISKSSLKVEKISFEMMINDVEYQIKWHNALLEELDDCIERSKDITELIRKIDFSELEISENPIINRDEDDDTSLEDYIKKFTS